MSACLFMISNIDKMEEDKLNELEESCYIVLGKKHDKNNKFECDYRAGMWHNLQSIFFERNRRIKKMIINESCKEHFDAIKSYSNRDGYDIEEIFYEFLKYERTQNSPSTETKASI